MEQPMRGARRWPIIGMGWVGATAVGLALGFGLWELLFPLVRSNLSRPLGGSLNAALDGAVVGICIGAAQFTALHKWTVLGAHWVAASVVGFGAGLAGAAWVAALLTQALGGHVSVALSDGSEVLAYGFLLGAGASVARAVAQHERGERLGRWALLGGTSYAVGYATTYGLFQFVSPASQPWLGVAFGLSVGILSGLLEWLLLGWASLMPGSPAAAQALGGKGAA